MVEVPRTLPPSKPDQTLTLLGSINAEHIRTLELQSVRARRMIEVARSMYIRALEMRKPPRIAHPW